MSTFLELTNDVLARLRESSVTSVVNTDYSIMIGKFVNDGKVRVENAWNWEAMRTTITLPTIASTSNYVVTGSGTRQKTISINDTTSKVRLHNRAIQWILDQQQLTTVQTAHPVYYSWYGNNGTDSKIEIFPTPDGVYSLKLNMYVPQVLLTADADIVVVPTDPIVAYAYARALAERGEDGGLASSEAMAVYQNTLSDYIALDGMRSNENTTWVAV
ncbi:hypothetical protein UFOVP1464_38 [uncultured Caudovirales phage]|uniref:Uncharacterized protein n=1 Tax=uncultured Caudovirales phage TaxID=2100421 RepID=A0A6J5SKR7_9CAUD|nr:hypothetical protein UFOVP1103_12 [uncultured Caudovirales phage]CAB4214408.1 hypothetical protein UFOVP1464_38 [uncultured Caudovirales phage]CAB5229334.1 hypothetical protein UFOVP1553_24 [uncultured Caudovirales phage]